MNGEDDIYDLLDKQSAAAFHKGEATTLVRYQIKIVPDSSPNDGGKWIDVPRAPPRTRSWFVTVEAYAEFVPPGRHMVAVQTVHSGPANCGKPAGMEAAPIALM